MRDNAHQSLRCPRCGGVLIEHEAGSTWCRYWECTSCYSAWHFVDGKLDRGRVLMRGAEWMPDREADMSKRHDLRNGKEDPRWKPGKWSPARARLEVKHVKRHALSSLKEITPPETLYAAVSYTVCSCDVALSKLGILEAYGPDRLRELYPNG